MPRDFRFQKPQYRRQAPRPPRENTSGRSDAPGDPPLEVPALELGAPFRFDAAFARRLARREVNEKEAFTVRDASGTFFRASLKELGAEGGSAAPYERCAVSPEPAVEITLACAVLARQRMLFVAQKATELGVSRIAPLLTEHSVPAQGLSHEKAHAWPGQIVRAAKQCRRSSLPELLPAATLGAFLASPVMAQAQLKLCLDNVGGKKAAAGENHKNVLLIVGPEGGFSSVEREMLEGKAIPWLLGGRVLRAETAVLVGLAAVQLQWGLAPMIKGLVLGAAGVLAALAAGAYFAATLGRIPANADAKPPALEKWLARTALDAAIARQAPKAPNPAPETDANLIAGIKLYAANCAVCHGASDAQPSAVALGLYQKAPQLARYGVEDDEDGEIYWVLYHGIRMTGMPSFRESLSDRDLWKLVLFLRNMDSLPPAPQKAWDAVPSAARLTAANPKKRGAS